MMLIKRIEERENHHQQEIRSQKRLASINDRLGLQQRLANINDRLSLQQRLANINDRSGLQQRLANINDRLGLQQRLANISDRLVLQQRLANINDRLGLQQRLANINDRLGLQQRLANIKGRLGLQQRLASINDRLGLQQRLANIKGRLGLQQRLASINDRLDLQQHLANIKDEIKSEWDFKLPDAVPSLDRRTQSTDSRKSALSDMVDDPVFNNKKEAAPGHPVIRESQVEQEAQEDIQPLLTIGKKKAPPKLAARKPIVYYRTANNQIRRVYRNRCERYCLGPLSIVVDAVGVLVITMVNLVLLSFAVVSLGVGVTINEKLEPYNKSIIVFKRKFDDSMRALGISKSGADIPIEEYLDIAVVPLFLIGAVLASISLMGIIGAVFNYQSLLYLYTRVCAILMLIEFCTYLFIYDGEPDLLKDKMVDSLKKYSGLEGNNTITRLWNILMNSLHCCGVNSYKDFKTSDLWPPSKIGGQTHPLVTPVFCCKNKSVDFSCAITPNAQNNNMDTGCHITLYNFIFRNKWALLVVYTTLACQATVLFFGSWMHWSRALMSEMPVSKRK
ncbi:hypothetical protein RRG08_043468 [Elysia crispata]|uniref:Tetraspanin n=1 Tax=Elysia crispata TaxID=231223 RepID=A0AAE0YG26_9GAST|nr:hypothetical protein RRG08_043468 [Elysia crispata]